MSMIRQTILIREDLQFPIGLLAAQVSHIGELPLIDQMLGFLEDNEPIESPEDAFENKDLVEWLSSPFKFVHGVPNQEVLHYFINRAKEHDVPVLTWNDTVYLKVGDKDEPFEDVIVGASLGPCDSDKIKMVIGTLDLLR